MLNLLKINKKILEYIILLRPKQWIKNFFIFAPLIFSSNFNVNSSIINSVICFSIFVLASSIVYIINDLYDYEKDIKHPLKKIHRPIASGKISFLEAKIFLFLLISLTIFLYIILLYEFFYIVFIYIFLNFLYSMKLKHYHFIDIIIISLGFIMRIYSGAIAISVEVSMWMILTTFMIGIFLGSVKRYQELNFKTKEIEVSKFYNLTTLKILSFFSSSFCVISYFLYVFFENSNLIYSFLFVFTGISRYWFISFKRNKGESPTDTILSDLLLITIILLWLIFIILKI